MRRQSREIALQILFQTEFAPQISFQDLFSIHGEKQEPEVIRYADEIVRGVLLHKENIDKKIAHLKKEIDRLEKSKVSLGPLLGMNISDIRDAMNY